MKNDISHLSDRLKKLIYNPDLFPQWQLLPDNKKVYMFHKLFLFLNGEFQQEFGEKLSQWVSHYSEGLELAKKRIFVPGPAKNLTHKKNHINPYELRAKEIGFDKKYYLKSAKIILEPVKLCRILMRDVFFFAQEIDLPISAPVVGTHDHMRKEYEHFGDLINRREYDQRVADFMGFLDKVKIGEIPDTIYVAIKIHHPKDYLLYFLANEIEKIQRQYFRESPGKKSPMYGHKEYKDDKKGKRREKTYPFYEWARYYTTYILFTERGMKQRDIAKELFRHEDLWSSAPKVSQDIRKARKLINNAWAGDFPGEYS